MSGAKQSGPNLDQANPSPGLVQNGSTLSGANLNRIGYLLGKYGTTTDNTTARTLKTLMLEKGRALPWGVYNSNNGGASQPDLMHNRGGLRDAVDAMWSEAINYAGPYAAAPNLTVTVNEDGAGGTVSGIGFQSAANLWVPGYTWTAMIVSGNAVWADNGNVLLNGTTSTAQLSRAFTALPGATGQVVVDLTIGGVPDHRVYLIESVNPQYQDVVYGGRISLTTEDDSVLPVFDEMEISITTTTSHAVATPGTALTDTLVVDLVSNIWTPEDHTASVVSTLYGPFSEAPVDQATVPAVAPVVGTVTTTITGPGTYVTPAITVTEPGYYVWHETVAADEFLLAWSGRFGVASETTLVPWSPGIVTAISTQALLLGEDVADLFTLSGGRPGETVTVTGQLYRHPSADAPTQQATVPTGAVLVGTTSSSVTVGSGGEVSGTLPAIAHGDVPGHYTWVVSTPDTTTMNAYTSDYGIAAETGVLAWSPQIATEISAEVLQADVPVGDAFTISGGRPGETVTVTGQLYRHPSADAPTQQATVPTGAVLLDTVSSVATIGADGTVSGTLPTVTHGNVPGYYTWVVSTPASSTMNAYTSDYGILSETGVYLWTPTMETTIEHSDLVVDVPVGDAFTISGGRPGETVTVTGQLYRDAGHTAPTQSAVIPSSAVAVASTSQSVVIGSDGTASGELPAMTHGNIPGYYTWVVSTPASSTMNAYTSDYGIPAETGVLVAEPTITTQVTTGTLTAGIDASDDFWIVDGRPGMTVEVTGRLYRHESNSPPTQQPTVPSGSELIATTTETVTLDEDGGAVGSLSAAHGDVPGYYTWVVSTPGSDVMNAYTSDYGIAAETTLLRWDVAASTTAASSFQVSVEQGGRRDAAAQQRPLGTLAIVDELTLTGLPEDFGNQPGEDEPVTMSLYFVHHTQARSIADLADMCTTDSLIFTDELVAVNGVQTTAAFEIPLLLSDAQDGFYTWVHSHPGSERVGAFEGFCGEASETLYLTPSAITMGLAITGADVSLAPVALGLILAGVALMFARRFVSKPGGSQ